MRMTFQNLEWSVILGLLLGLGVGACSTKDDSSGDDGAGSGSGTTSEGAGADGGTTSDDGGTGGTGGGSGSDTSDDGGTSGTGGTGGTTGTETGTGETTDTGDTASTGGTTGTGAGTGSAGTGSAGTGSAGTGTAGTGTGSGTACEGTLSGACLGLVGGCASCPEGSLVSGTDAGCPDSTWCCVPYYPPGNSCHTAGGVCVFNMPQVICPPGWQAAQNLDCGGALSLDCCMPGDSCV